MKNIQFKNSICYQQPPNGLYYSIFFLKKNANIMKMCLLTHQVSHLFSKLWALIAYHAYPFYKLSNDSSKISSLHLIIQLKKDMLVELCVSNYATSNGLVNGDDIFKASTTYNEKIIIRILMFQNSKIGTLTKNKINHNYDNHIESKWTLVKLIIKDIKVGKPNHLLQQFNFQFNL